MSNKKKIGVGGGILVAAAAGAVGLARLLGSGVDDAGRIVERIPAPPPRVPPVVIHPPVVLPPEELTHIKATIDQGIITFNDLRRGDTYERAAAKAGCAAMNQFISQTPTYDEIKNGIYGQLSPELQPNGSENGFVSKHVDKVAEITTVVSESNGRLGYYYVKFCGVK